MGGVYPGKLDGHCVHCSLGNMVLTIECEWASKGAGKARCYGARFAYYTLRAPGNTSNYSLAFVGLCGFKPWF